MMTDKAILDPTNIVGPLTSDTPIFIIEYILNVCRQDFNVKHLYNDKYYENALEIIKKYKFPEIDKPSVDSSDEDIREIRKFISPKTTLSEWFVESIIIGYDHLKLFNINDDELPQLTKNKLIFGDKTNVDPYIINELIVYIICKIHNYSMNRYTTFAELCFFVEIVE